MNGVTTGMTINRDASDAETETEKTGRRPRHLPVLPRDTLPMRLLRMHVLHIADRFHIIAP